MAGQERGRRQGGRPIIVLLLVHGRHQTEVSDLNHVVHGEEDVGGLSDRLHMFNGHKLVEAFRAESSSCYALDSQEAAPLERIHVRIDFCRVITKCWLYQLLLT